MWRRRTEEVIQVNGEAGSRRGRRGGLGGTLGNTRRAQENEA